MATITRATPSAAVAPSPREEDPTRIVPRKPRAMPTAWLRRGAERRSRLEMRAAKIGIAPPNIPVKADEIHCWAMGMRESGMATRNNASTRIGIRSAGSMGLRARGST